MEIKTLLIIPVTFENPENFKDLFNHIKVFSEFDLLISISTSNRYIEEYNLLTKKHYKRVHIISSNSNNKLLLFKNAVQKLNSKETGGYKYVMSVKYFKNEYINILYSCINNISNSNLKLLYPTLKSTRNKKVIQSEIFIIEIDFLKKLKLNPFHKYETIIKIFRNTHLKKINLT